MLKNKLVTAGLLILFFFSTISCKKENTTDALTGAWQEIGLNGLSRRLIFNPGGKFTMQIVSNTGEINERNGSYALNGENLSVHVTEEVDRNASNVVTRKSKVDKRLFDNGKYSIANAVLTLNYTFYPADAPVDTETKYNKIMAID